MKKDQPIRVNKVNSKEAFHSALALLKQEYGPDKAAKMAVGGEFEAIGLLELETLKYFGLQEDSYVIDVGCGAGRLSYPLSAFPRCRYLGIDIVPELIDHARRIAMRSDWRFEVAEGLRIPERDETADIVCFFSVFTHLLHEQTYVYLQEAKRVLKAGGKIVFSFLDFTIPDHWHIFESNIKDIDVNSQPLNMFISKEAIPVWADHLGLKLRAVEDGNKPFIPLSRPIFFENGSMAEKVGSIGQSVCVLQKETAKIRESPAEPGRPHGGFGEALTRHGEMANGPGPVVGNQGSDAIEPIPPGQEQERDPLDDMIPDYSLANYVGGGGPEQFRTVGRVMIDWFKAFCDLRPDERVLEVGSGIGRIAIPLTQYLTKGSYVGFDIIRHGIEWCQQKVTPRYPNFRFFVADVYNKYYHPEGRQAAREYAFPFDPGSFDFVFLASVFTHMLPKDLEHYTAEISRVLRPGGRCFCTAYVITADGARQLAEGASRIAFKPYPEGYWSDTPENPEHAVAYPEEYLSRVFQGRGLTITRLIPGEWWKHEFAQDILIASKPPQAV